MWHFTRQQDYTLEESSLLEGEGAGVIKDGLRRVRWFSSGKKFLGSVGKQRRQSAYIYAILCLYLCLDMCVFVLQNEWKATIAADQSA